MKHQSFAALLGFVILACGCTKSEKDASTVAEGSAASESSSLPDPRLEKLSGTWIWDEDGNDKLILFADGKAVGLKRGEKVKKLPNGSEVPTGEYEIRRRDDGIFRFDERDMLSIKFDGEREFSATVVDATPTSRKMTLWMSDGPTSLTYAGPGTKVE